MAFGRIKVPKIIASEGPITDVYRKALDIALPQKYTKEPILRPSGFPICSILRLIAMRQFETWGYCNDEGSLNSDFYTGVGTNVHEIVQKWMGFTGNVLGDWQCTNSKCERGVCTNSKCKDSKCTNHEHYYVVRKVGNLCKKCGEPMQYHELEVESGIITGHVDCIVRVGEDEYWANDYKTTSVEKINEIKSPSINYLYQIMAYAHILRKEYDINIVGYSVFYITRDKCTVFKEFPYEFDSTARAKAAKIIEQETVKYEAAKRSNASNVVSHAIQAKPCKSAEHYERLMGPHCKCEFVNVCFGKTLKSTVTKALSDIK